MDNRLFFYENLSLECYFLHRGIFKFLSGKIILLPRECHALVTDLPFQFSKRALFDVNWIEYSAKIFSFSLCHTHTELIWSFGGNNSVSNKTGLADMHFCLALNSKYHNTNQWSPSCSTPGGWMVTNENWAVWSMDLRILYFSVWFFSQPPKSVSCNAILQFLHW